LVLQEDKKLMVSSFIAFLFGYLITWVIFNFVDEYYKLFKYLFTVFGSKFKYSAIDLPFQVPKQIKAFALDLLDISKYLKINSQCELLKAKGNLKSK
jgi:hypothetical protein